jgi:hypothetical protein
MRARTPNELILFLPNKIREINPVISADEEKSLNESLKNKTGGISYYHIFGVSPTATSAEIKTFYRNNVIKFHPDHAEDERDRKNREILFKQFHIAYSVLTDDTQRREYDFIESQQAPQQFGAQYRRSMLVSLQKANILNQGNREIVENFSDPEALSSALEYLYLQHLLNQENFNFVIKYQDIYTLSSYLNILKNEGVLNQDFFIAVVKYKDKGPHDFIGKLLGVIREKQFAVSFFGSKQRSMERSMLVEVIKLIYRENKGNITRAWLIFRDCHSYQDAIDALQKRYREKLDDAKNDPKKIDKIKSEATYKTLKDFGEVPGELGAESRPEPRN